MANKDHKLNIKPLTRYLQHIKRNKMGRLTSGTGKSQSILKSQLHFQNRVVKFIKAAIKHVINFWKCISFVHAYIINKINSQIKFLRETALLEYYWFCKHFKVIDYIQPKFCYIQTEGFN